MVSDKAIFYNNKKTIDMLYMEEEERPIVQQIFGSDKESFVKAAIFIEENMKPDIIDINMGCPVPKVAVKSQAGAALLKNPEKIKQIFIRVAAGYPKPFQKHRERGRTLPHFPRLYSAFRNTYLVTHFLSAEICFRPAFCKQIPALISYFNVIIKHISPHLPVKTR